MPNARSVADSLRRCRTAMAMVLNTTKMPTRSATALVSCSVKGGRVPTRLPRSFGAVHGGPVARCGAHADPDHVHRVAFGNLQVNAVIPAVLAKGELRRPHAHDAHSNALAAP